jgi:pimeloyl-ACP methyl ester carboxylesterase
MPRLWIEDIDIYYEIAGEGEAIVLIAGLAGSGDVWFRQIPALSRMYSVVTFDNRGSGRSDKPDIPYTMKIYARDTMALLDNLGIDRAHIFGISMGGMIAQEFALNYQERVISLILGCTSCGGDGFVLPDGKTLEFLLNRRYMNQQGPEERIREMLVYSFTREFIRSRTDIVEQYVAIKLANWPKPRSFFKQIEAVMTHDTCDRLSQIRVPTLVISGSADKQIPVKNSEILAAGIPDAELVILSDTGHGFVIEAADQVNEAVIDFLKSHQTTPQQDENQSTGPLQPLPTN